MLYLIWAGILMSVQTSKEMGSSENKLFTLWRHAIWRLVGKIDDLVQMWRDTCAWMAEHSIWDSGKYAVRNSPHKPVKIVQKCQYLGWDWCYITRCIGNELTVEDLTYVISLKKVRKMKSNWFFFFLNKHTLKRWVILFTGCRACGHFCLQSAPRITRPCSV